MPTSAWLTFRAEHVASDVLTWVTSFILLTVSRSSHCPKRKITFQYMNVKSVSSDACKES